MNSTDTFKALIIHEEDRDHFTGEIASVPFNALPSGDVLIRVHYSSLNYKDALSANGNRGVTRKYPHTPGVDAAGTVIESASNACKEGDPVLVCGFDLGMNTHGGFSEYIRVPAEWMLPKPDELSLKQCMQIGTAGFTAAQCVDRLLEHGTQPDNGPILVTGATGGVGCVAVMLLHAYGFTITAVTGKDTESQFLQSLGADNIINRHDFVKGSNKMLLRERWAGVVDTVGGEILSTAIKSTCYNGCVTCCGNAASADLALNVYPFILRGVCLQGIDSASCSLERRRQVWQRFTGKWNLPVLAGLSTTISLNELMPTIKAMLAGKTKGRYVVDLGAEQ